MFRCLLVAPILLAFAAVVASAADRNDAERLAASHAKWQEAKEACGGNYRYKAIRSSVTGDRAETVVVVKDNKVVERRFDTATPAQPGKPARLNTELVETGKDIGLHQGAADPRTRDKLYAVAKKIVEMEIPANHVRRLAFDKLGLLQCCFLRDARIQDDGLLTGVTTIYLTLAKK